MRHHHHHRRHYRHHRHSRFGSFWYWASGLAIIELEIWMLAALAIAAWCGLWLTAEAVMWAAGRFWCVPDPVLTAIRRSRPRWPSAARRHITRPVTP